MILTPHPGNGLLGWPEEWTDRRYNACNEPCDFLIGPCACGAMHHEDEDWVQEALRQHNAVVMPARDNRTDYPTPECLDPHEVDDYVRRSIDADRIEHVERCPFCQVYVRVCNGTSSTVRAGDVVTFRAYEGQSNHWLTVGQVEDGMADCYWFTPDNELRKASMPVETLVKVETRGTA